MSHESTKWLFCYPCAGVALWGVGSEESTNQPCFSWPCNANNYCDHVPLFNTSWFQSLVHYCLSFFITHDPYYKKRKKWERAGNMKMVVKSDKLVTTKLNFQIFSCVDRLEVWGVGNSCRQMHIPGVWWSYWKSDVCMLCSWGGKISILGHSAGELVGKMMAQHCVVSFVGVSW